MFTFVVPTYFLATEKKSAFLVGTFKEIKMACVDKTCNRKSQVGSNK